MTKTAYLIDVFTRGFFIFVVLQLLLRNGFLSLFLTVSINLIYEFTIGRKFWQAWKSTPQKPRRSRRQVCLDLWRRVFSRERTKGFVFAGFVLLLMSYFVRLNIYYLVVSCIVFTLAAISRFAPPTKSATISHESAHDEKVCPTNCPPTATA